MYRTGIGGDGGDDEKEIEGDDELDKESLGGADGGDGDAAGEEGMVDALEGERGAYGGRHLRGDVRGDLHPREVAEHREGDGERRVEVGARDVACRENDDHDGEPRARCVADQRLRAIVLLVHDWRRRRAEDEDEGAHELSS